MVKPHTSEIPRLSIPDMACCVCGRLCASCGCDCTEHETDKEGDLREVREMRARQRAERLARLREDAAASSGNGGGVGGVGQAAQVRGSVRSLRIELEFCLMPWGNA